MTEPIGAGGLVDTETAIRREIDVLAQRFPTVERGELERCVRETFEELKQGAEVETHLLALTRAQVTEKLRERGVTVHVRGEDAEDGEPAH